MDAQSSSDPDGNLHVSHQRVGQQTPWFVRGPPGGLVVRILLAPLVFYAKGGVDLRSNRLFVFVVREGVLEETHGIQGLVVAHQQNDLAVLRGSLLREFRQEAIAGQLFKTSVQYIAALDDNCVSTTPAVGDGIVDAGCRQELLEGVNVSVDVAHTNQSLVLAEVDIVLGCVRQRIIGGNIDISRQREIFSNVLVVGK